MTDEQGMSKYHSVDSTEGMFCDSPYQDKPNGCMYPTAQSKADLKTSSSKSLSQKNLKAWKARKLLYVPPSGVRFARGYSNSIRNDS